MTDVWWGLVWILGPSDLLVKVIGFGIMARESIGRFVFR
jgi:hypothetical protein